MKTANEPTMSKTTEMKIGKVNYIVTTHYNNNGRETAEQKLFRFVTDRIAEDAKKPQNTAKLSV